MPQKRPFGTPEEEIEEFARRMINELEEIDFAYNRQDWLNFVADKMFATTGRTLTDAQLDALDRGRDSVFGMWGDVSIGPELPFITRPTQIRYRDLVTGRWTSRAAVSQSVLGLIKRGGAR